MAWIDDMLASGRKAKDADALERKNAKHSSSVETVEHSSKQIDGARAAWAKLLSILQSDINDFNNNKNRTRQNHVLTSDETSSVANFHFEVYLPEMNSKLLVITLEGSSLHIMVRPAYPEQRSTITLEFNKLSKHNCWILCEPGHAIREITDHQLSETLLKPLLSSAEID